MFRRAVLSLFAVVALACANGCCYCQSNHCWFLPHCGFMGAQACDCPDCGILDCLRCNRCNSCGGCGECGGGCGGGCGCGGCALFDGCHGNNCGCGCGNWCGGSKYPDMGCSGICWDGYDDCGCDPCDNCGNWVGGGGCSSCGGEQYSSGGYSQGWSEEQFASTSRVRRGGTTMVASKQSAPPREMVVHDSGERFTGRTYSTAGKPKSVMQQPTPVQAKAKSGGRSVSYETRAGERTDEPQKYELR